MFAPNSTRLVPLSHAGNMPPPQRGGPVEGTTHARRVRPARSCATLAQTSMYTTLGIAQDWAGGGGSMRGNAPWRCHRRRHQLLVSTKVAATAPPDRKATLLYAVSRLLLVSTQAAATAPPDHRATPLSVGSRRLRSAKACRVLRGCCARVHACPVRAGSCRASATGRRRSDRRGGGGVGTAA